MDLPLFSSLVLLYISALPAAAIAALKGRLWVGVVGFACLVSFLVFWSELRTNSAAVIPGLSGLFLLMFSPTLRARAGSWWDRRYGSMPKSARRGLLVGTAVPVVLLAAGFFGGPIGQALGVTEGMTFILIGAAAALLFVIIMAVVTLLRDSAQPLFLTSVAAGAPAIVFGFFTAVINGVL